MAGMYDPKMTLKTTEQEATQNFVSIIISNKIIVHLQNILLYKNARLQ